MRRSLWIWTQGLFAALAMMVLVLPPAQAEVPRTMAFQGKLTDAAGQPINGTQTVTFRIYTAASGGAKLWEEVKTLPVSGGLFSTQLGDTVALTLPFDQPYWVEIAVGGETLAPRQPLGASPYALRAQSLEGINVVGGNVGIGTANPQFFSTAADRYFAVDAGANNIARLGIGANAGVGIYTGALHFYNTAQGDADKSLSAIAGRSEGNINSGTFEIWTVNNGAFGQRLVVTPAGGVGINTATPGFTLHVNGSAGKPGGGAWSDSSDLRLKKGVEPMAGALAKLLSLRGVTFEWKDPARHGNLTGRQMGMIGQEVEKVFPEWVSEDAVGMKMLSIRGFEALTVEAIRELKAENESLKKQIEALKKTEQ